MDPEKFPRGDIRERSVFGGVGGGPNAVFGNFNVNKRILVLQEVQPRPPNYRSALRRVFNGR